MKRIRDWFSNWFPERKQPETPSQIIALSNTVLTPEPPPLPAATATKRSAMERFNWTTPDE